MDRIFTVLEHIGCLVEHANDYRKLAKYMITNSVLIEYNTSTKEYNTNKTFCFCSYRFHRDRIENAQGGLSYFTIRSSLMWDGMGC